LSFSKASVIMLSFSFITAYETTGEICLLWGLLWLLILFRQFNICRLFAMTFFETQTAVFSTV
jgi:hypothetical protein